MSNLESLSKQLADDEKLYSQLSSKKESLENYIRRYQVEIDKLTFEQTKVVDLLSNLLPQIDALKKKIDDEKFDMEQLTANIPALNASSFKHLAGLIALAAHEQGIDLLSKSVAVDKSTVTKFKVRTVDDLDILYGIMVTRKKKLNGVVLTGKEYSYDELISLTNIKGNLRALLQNIIYREVLGLVDAVDTEVYEDFIKLTNGNYIALLDADGTIVRDSNEKQRGCKTYAIGVDALGNHLVAGVPYYTKRDFFRGLFDDDLSICINAMKNIEFSFKGINDILESKGCKVEGDFLRYEVKCK